MGFLDAFFGGRKRRTPRTKWCWRLRGREIAAVPMGKSREIGVGDSVMLKATEGPARVRSLEISREFARTLQRGA